MDSFVAKITSDATGGGWYNADRKILDATNVNTNANIFAAHDDGAILVLNVVESNTALHALGTGAYIFGSVTLDDEKNKRYWGLENFGRTTIGACS